jgi:hypothetical protein
MKLVTLEAFTDAETGEVGLGIQGCTTQAGMNAAHSGTTIAHDLVEHINGPQFIGQIDDELEALGAIWYTRGQHGELSRDGSGSAYTLHQNLASDVTRMFAEWIATGRQQMKWLPVTGIVTAEPDLLQVLDDAENSWRSEFSDDEDTIRAAARCWDDYRAEALVRMRTGYRKARRRYEGYGRYAANSLFWAISDAVQPHAKRSEYEGQLIQLRYSIKDGTATCEELYE